MSTVSNDSSGKQVDAPLMPLPVRLETVQDEESDRTFTRLIHGSYLQREMANFWMRNFVCYAALILGIYSAVIGGQVFLACIIMTIGISLFLQHRVIARSLNGSVLVDRPPMNVTFEITDAGMLELDRGVESRFAWSAISQWIMSEGVLCIQLVNGRWAVLPAKGMQPSTVCLQSIVTLLMHKGVAGRRREP